MAQDAWLLAAGLIGAVLSTVVQAGKLTVEYLTHSRELRRLNRFSDQPEPPPETHPAARVLDRVASTRFDIGRSGSRYLTRWTLLRLGAWRVYVHRFYRSDWDDAYHDHPWSFWSLILWGGYWEHTPARWEGRGRYGTDKVGDRRRWYGPGRVLTRPAGWRHWVELPAGSGGRVWSLVVTAPKEREWYFWCPRRVTFDWFTQPDEPLTHEDGTEFGTVRAVLAVPRDVPCPRGTPADKLVPIHNASFITNIETGGSGCGA